jgi:hypothetical protein
MCWGTPRGTCGCTKLWGSGLWSRCGPGYSRRRAQTCPELLPTPGTLCQCVDRFPQSPASPSRVRRGLLPPLLRTASPFSTVRSCSAESSVVSSQGCLKRRIIGAERLWHLIHPVIGRSDAYVIPAPGLHDGPD